MKSEKKVRITKAILIKKSKAGGTKTPDSKLYNYKQLIYTEINRNRGLGP